ncbi:MAG: M23 family metallopeptidase [Ignavibacteria bacterium]|nr:M23 family metallopeptidase [Ignavibacteria bacterium]
MMNERSLIIIRLIATQLVLIICLICLSLFTTVYTFYIIAITQVVLSIVYFTGYWEFFAMRFKKIFCFSTEIILFAILFLKLYSYSAEGTNLYITILLLAVLAFLIYELIKIIYVIYAREKENAELKFPFGKGKYIITDGGNSKVSRLMNYHYHSKIHKMHGTSDSMLFAADIVKLSDTGKRFLPHHNRDYPIFGEKIFSPISGVVVKVIDDIDDNIPFSGNYPYNTGNTIVIREENKYLLLGHLKKGSITKKPGDVIQEGEQAAEAGNSGFTERPHLHMQFIYSETEKYWSGKGIAIQYKGKNFYKNRLIEI